MFRIAKNCDWNLWRHDIAHWSHLVVKNGLNDLLTWNDGMTESYVLEGFPPPPQKKKINIRLKFRGLKKHKILTNRVGDPVEKLVSSFRRFSIAICFIVDQSTADRSFVHLWPKIAWHDVTKTSFSQTFLARFSWNCLGSRQIFVP